MNLFKSCLVCGDTFYKKENMSKVYWESRKYCSSKCSIQKTSIDKVGGNYWKGKKMPEDVRKKISNALVGRKPTSGCFKKGDISFNKGKKFPERSGENHPMWKEKTIKNCKLCSKEMILAPWQTKRVFCSQECTKQFMTGENSPTYKGELGTEKLRTKVKSMKEYILWRKQILERDCYQCTICSSNENLEVDHIKRFYLIAIENNIKTIVDARNCKELWEINNGRVLCRKCHRKTDTFGTTGLKYRK